MTNRFEQVGFEAVIIGLGAFVSGANQVNTLTQRINASTQALAGDGTRGWGAFSTAAKIGLVGVTTAISAASAAVASLGTIAGVTAAKYEKSMVQVQVLSKATTRNMSELDDALFKIGTTTNVSMNQAAEGAIELAKAGLTVKDQIDGALESVVNFTIASAGDVGMSEAAITVAKALTVWGLEGKDAARVTDALTSAAQSSVLSYKDLTRSFQQAANISALLGLSIEDLSAVIAVMGQAGLRGSDAGTSLKQMFIELLSPSKDAAKLMEQFGISLFDVEGKARPFRDVIISIQDAFSDQAIATGKLTEAERAHALAVIFGSDAIRAAVVSAKFGVEAFDEFKGAIERTKASDIANLFMKPTSVQLEILKNQLLSASQVLGNEFLEGFRGAIMSMVAFNATITKQDIKDFAGVILNIAASSIVLAGRLKDTAFEAASMGYQFLQSREAAFGLTIALSIMAGPTIVGGIASLTAAVAAMTKALASAAMTGYMVALTIQSGGLVAGLKALSLAIGTTAFAFAGIGLVIGVLTLDLGGARTALIQLASLIMGTFLHALFMFNQWTLEAARSLSQLIAITAHYSGASGVAAQAAAWTDELTLALARNKEESDKTTVAIYDAGQEMINTANKATSLSGYLDSLGGFARGTAADFMALGAAVRYAMDPRLAAERQEEGDIFAGTTGPSRVNQGKIQTEIEEQIRNSREELEKLLGTIPSAGGASTLPGFFNDTEDAAGKAAKAIKEVGKSAEELEKERLAELKRQLDALNASIDPVLVSSFNNLFSAITGAFSVGTLTASLSTALTLIETKVNRLVQIGVDAGSTGIIGRILGTAATNIAGATGTGGEASAVDAVNALQSGVDTLIALAEQGQNVTAAIGLMNNALDVSAVKLTALGAEDYRVAEELMRAYRELIVLVQEGTITAEDFALAVSAIQTEWMRLAETAEAAIADTLRRSNEALQNYDETIARNAASLDKQLTESAALRAAQAEKDAKRQLELDRMVANQRLQLEVEAGHREAARRQRQYFNKWLDAVLENPENTYAQERLADILVRHPEFESRINPIDPGNPNASKMADALALIQNMLANLPSFATGGIVPGYMGQPSLAMVHGQERIIPANVRSTEAALTNNILTQMLSLMRQPNTSYVVNASYSNQQSPFNIGMDLRAMVAMTK